MPVSLWANPSGEQVVYGDTTFLRQGNTLTITQGTQQTIINWQDFSIGLNELTQFFQPNNDAIALNRVISGNPSLLYGSLQANGQVWLINPNGIMVGPNGQIDTQSFLASTLDITNEDFLNGGSASFLGSSNAGIENQGNISASGGDILLFARTIENTGTLSALGGTVGLGAGTEILLMETGEERIMVQAGSETPDENGVLNQGTIQAVTAELKAEGGNLYGLAVNNAGVFQATGF
ncbi:MAG: filamentous hemagglutinin N-terminal domain-containing protein [Verrucomicrobiota bacterium]